MFGDAIHAVRPRRCNGGTGDPRLTLVIYLVIGDVVLQVPGVFVLFGRAGLRAGRLVWRRNDHLNRIELPVSFHLQWAISVFELGCTWVQSLMLGGTIEFNGVESNRR